MDKVKILKKKNNEKDELLSKEYQDIITDMVIYLKFAPISSYQVELVRQDLLDMALSAEKRNEPLPKVFGEDYKQFCDDRIENLKKQGKVKNILTWFVYLVLGGYAILAVIDIIFSGYLLEVIKSIASHSKVNLMYPITLEFTISTAAIMIATYSILYLVCKNLFKVKKAGRKFSLQSRVKRFFTGALVGAFFGCLFVFAKLSKIVLFSINIFIYIGIIAALFIICKIYKD